MSKKIFRVLLISFILLFFVYLLLQKKFDKMENPVKEDKSFYINNPIPNNMAYNIKLAFFDNCEDNACYNIDLENIKSEVINENNMNINIKCLKKEHIDEDEINYCTKLGIIVDDKVNLEIDTIKNYYYDESVVIFKTDNNYIIKEYNTLFGSGVLNIYDNNGSLLKNITNSINSYEIVEDDKIEENTNKYDVSISDNKLYYAYTEDMDYVLGLNNFVHVGYIKLDSDLEYVELYKIKAITSLGI